MLFSGQTIATMGSSRLKSFFLLLVFFMGLVFLSCKKDAFQENLVPSIYFKSSAGYIYKDTVATLNDTLLAGIVCVRTDKALTTFNASVAYDGSTVTNTFYNYNLTAAEADNYTKDLEIVTRNQTGTERWVFTITDSEGGTSQITFTLSVQ